MKIGLIADTHDHFDPRIPELFAGVDHILHAGDICRPNIVQALEQIAPVTAILGNNDQWLPYREMELVELDGLKILIRHIVRPANPQDSIHGAVERAQADLVVFGHTHIAYEQRFGRTLFVNPGYAGRQRFAQKRSVALCHTQPELRVEFLGL
ncbi:MAG: metallophosphoesterase family protein [Verrucomicrobiota bacterium]